MVRLAEELTFSDDKFRKVIENSDEEQFLEIQVMDNGIGIKEEDKIKLF